MRRQLKEVLNFREWNHQVLLLPEPGCKLVWQCVETIDTPYNATAAVQNSCFGAVPTCWLVPLDLCLQCCTPNAEAEQSANASFCSGLVALQLLRVSQRVGRLSGPGRLDGGRAAT